MAYSKNRRLADLVATDGTMDAAKLKSGTVTQAHLHSSHGITTAHITEGSNKYYTDERVDDRSNSLLQDGANITLTYNDSAGTLTVAATDTNTTYSAGTGLALSSTTFSLSHLGLQSLSDPNADRIAFWDDSAGAFAWLTIGSNLTLSGTTLSGVAAYGDSDARAAISVTDSGGDGSCSYNSSNGVITYTGPSAAEVRAHLSAGTGVTYSGGEISIGQAVATSSNVTFANVAATGNVTVTGNLTVNGTQTTLSTATLDVEDKNITLNKGSGDTSASADGAGITIQDAVDASTDASLTWRASDDKFIFSHPLRMFGQFELPDNVKLVAGDGNDLQIYHDGSHSYIKDAGTGNLQILATHLQINNSANSQNMITASDGGAVTLYTAGTARFNTTSSGATVTGNLAVTGTVDGRDVATDGTKLDGIAASANNYSLPLGTSSDRGGFKIGYSESGKNYPVELSSEQMYVNVPWTDTNTTYSVGDGGLTQNNFTNTLKSKLDGIEASATADQSAAEILTAIKTVDGSGSGLDADTLDGLDSSFYFKSQTNNNGGWSQSNRNFSVRTGGDAVGLHMEESDGTFGFQLYADGSNYGFLDGEWAAWDIKKVTNGALQIDVGSGLQNVATQNWVTAQGYATSAASLTGSNSFTNSYNEFGNNTGAVSNDGSWHARVNISGTSHARMDLFEDGDDSKLYLAVHSGYSGRIGMLSNTDLEFLTNGSVRGKIDNTGYWQINAHTNSWDGGLRMISQDGTDTFQIHPDNNGYMYADKTWNFSNAPHVGIGNAVWHAGNDGSGSGLDADLLDGYQLNTGRANVANRVVATDSSGYIQAGWINSTSGDLGNTLPDRIYTSNDGYIRYADLATFRTLMHASAKTGYQGREQSTTDTNYWIGSMGWSSTDFDTVFDYGSGFIDGWSTPANTPSGTSHWVGFNALHYTNASARYGWQMVMGAGTNGLLFVKGKWNNAGSWAKVWNADNDGSGSGLDADLLDGANAAINGASTIHKIHSNGYSLLQNWQDVAGAGIYSSTVNGFHFYPNVGTSYGSGRLNGSRNGYSGIMLDHGGDVVIGMYDSSGNGGIYGEGTSGWEQYYHRSNGCLGITASTTSSSYSLYVTGAIYATGDIVGSSDKRLKKNIQVIDNGLEKVLALRGVTYEWKDKEKPEENNVTPERMGVIAQELLDIAPEVVVYDKENDRYGVEYGHLTGLLIEAIKDLNKKVEDLEKKLEEK